MTLFECFMFLGPETAPVGLLNHAPKQIVAESQVIYLEHLTGCTFSYRSRVAAGAALCSDLWFTPHTHRLSRCDHTSKSITYPKPSPHESTLLKYRKSPYWCIPAMRMAHSAAHSKNLKSEMLGVRLQPVVTHTENSHFFTDSNWITASPAGIEFIHGSDTCFSG
jgi:hypothetical protein